MLCVELCIDWDNLVFRLLGGFVTKFRAVEVVRLVAIDGLFFYCIWRAELEIRRGAVPELLDVDGSERFAWKGRERVTHATSYNSIDLHKLSKAAAFANKF